MKLVCLNTWGGAAFNPLIEFIRKQAGKVDIFCLQEIFSSKAIDIKQNAESRLSLLEDLKDILPNFNTYFSPSSEGFEHYTPVDFNLSFGLATFVRKTIHVESSKTVFTYRHLINSRDNRDYKTTEFPSNMLALKIKVSGRKYIICNFHGVAEPGTKEGTKIRLRQSTTIKNFLDKERGSKILCGDFNLLPHTQSIKLLENNLKNLITTFNINTTRSKISPWHNTPREQKYADYIMVSPDTDILNFDVLNVEISDHLPLILEFN